MDELYSLWLVPQKNDQEYLTKIITDLAGKYDSPTFIPHLTLAGDIPIDFESFRKAVDEVFAGIKAFNINVQRINSSEKFAKTVFIEFELDKNLKNLFNTLSEKIHKRDIGTFKPHLSLMYKLMAEEEKINIVKSLIIKKMFSFDKACITNPEKVRDDFYVVKDWQILYQKNLEN